MTKICLIYHNQTSMQNLLRNKLYTEYVLCLMNWIYWSTFPSFIPSVAVVAYFLLLLLTHYGRLCQVDNDDYVRRVLKTDDVKPATKLEPQRETSSRSKVRRLLRDLAVIC